MAALKGAPELRRRLRAIQTVFKPIGRRWADEYVVLARTRVPVKTGKLRRSIRRKNASMKRATVAASYVAFFIDAGTKRHEIQPKKFSGSRRGGPGTAKALRFDVGGTTKFARKTLHPGTRAQRFRRRTMVDALQRHPMAAELVKLWNEAA